jgi:hypothetical protein
MKNLKLFFLTLFSVISLSVFAQDTLTINGNNCMMVEGTSNTQLQNCNYDFDAVDTAWLMYVTLPNNPLGNMSMYWEFLDTTGAPTEFVTYDYPVITDGCYVFTLTISCGTDTVGINTVIVHDVHAVWVSWGLNELSTNNENPIKITDLMGRECKITDNQVMLYYYSNGQVRQVIKSE